MVGQGAGARVGAVVMVVKIFLMGGQVFGVGARARAMGRGSERVGGRKL